MSNTIGSVSIEINANISPLQCGIAKAMNAVAKFNAIGTTLRALPITGRINVGDAGEAARLWVAMLDGVECPLAFELDTEEGWIDRYKPDENGNPFLDPSRERIVTERLHGKIQIGVRE